MVPEITTITSSHRKSHDDISISSPAPPDPSLTGPESEPPPAKRARHDYPHCRIEDRQTSPLARNTPPRKLSMHKSPRSGPTPFDHATKPTTHITHTQGISSAIRDIDLYRSQTSFHENFNVPLDPSTNRSPLPPPQLSPSPPRVRPKSCRIVTGVQSDMSLQEEIDPTSIRSSPYRSRTLSHSTPGWCLTIMFVF